MAVYRNDLDREKRPLKCILHENSKCEVTSNDGTMRIILVKQHAYSNEIEQTAYVSNYYLQTSNKSWERVDVSHSYRSVREFIEALANAEDFSIAVREYEEQFNNINF